MSNGFKTSTYHAYTNYIYTDLQPSLLIAFMLYIALDKCVFEEKLHSVSAIFGKSCTRLMQFY